MTTIDREERTLEQWLRDTASPIPREIVDRSLAAIRGTPQYRAGWTVWPRPKALGLAGIAAAIVLGAVVSATFLRTSQPAFVPGAAPASPTGFAGVWTTTDCAQWWQGDRVDCSVWGDSSELSMTIGLGDEPVASYEDTSARCSARSAGPARFTATGTGMYQRPFLWLTFTSTGCPSFGKDGDGRLQLYRDPGSDTLWEDEEGDGWGLIWVRAQ